MATKVLELEGELAWAEVEGGYADPTISIIHKPGEIWLGSLQEQILVALGIDTRTGYANSGIRVRVTVERIDG